MLKVEYCCCVLHRRRNVREWRTSHRWRGTTPQKNGNAMYMYVCGWYILRSSRVFPFRLWEILAGCYIAPFSINSYPFSYVLPLLWLLLSRWSRISFPCLYCPLQQHPNPVSHRRKSIQPPFLLHPLDLFQCHHVHGAVFRILVFSLLFCILWCRLQYY
jgi:hypothetical protein